tara:strand:+ start:182 stop:823 length:642 start_codon:yes stop_codon:yes gene_type:complete
VNIEKIEVEKVGIPKINSLPTTPQITRELNIEKPGFDFIFPFFEPMRTNTVKMQRLPKTPAPTPPEEVKKEEGSTTKKNSKTNKNNIDGEIKIPDFNKKAECPAKDQQYRLGDIRNAKAKEKVIGFELVGDKCLEIWGPTNIADKYLPSASVASTTFGITIVATTAATITPLLTKALKPVFKKLIAKVKKLIGKKQKVLSTFERQKLQRDRKK